MDIVKLNKEQFEIVCDQLRINPMIEHDFLYDLYEYALEGSKEIVESNLLGRIVPVNSVVLILYLAHEAHYYLVSNKKTVEEVSKDEEAVSKIVSLSVDKYFTNEHLNFKNERFISKYSPIISTLQIYLNFVLGILGKYKKQSPNETLKLDFMFKGFSIAQAIIELIVDGFETEAFSNWRTLHENECILIDLEKYGKEVQEAYIKHMKYALAFRGGIPSKEETDKVFEQIKDEMKVLDLKSKDMKKYIEYGWLTHIPNVNEIEGFKLNFRDGVERVAGLSQYSKIYEMASEIAHSSPLLIYSRRDYYFHLTLLILYESFFRLEKIFTESYLKLIDKVEANRYFAMRNVYYKNLGELYQKEREIFQDFQSKSQKKKEA